MGLELRFGDYPYAACYGVDNWERGDWKGLWFANETTSAIIYIPEKYNQDLRAFGFCHEIGHMLDEAIGINFDDCEEDVWEGEVSAWQWASILLDKYHNGYDKLAYRDDVTRCLGTYADNRNISSVQWIDALRTIGVL